MTALALPAVFVGVPLPLTLIIDWQWWLWIGVHYIVGYVIFAALFVVLWWWKLARIVFGPRDDSDLDDPRGQG